MMTLLRVLPMPISTYLNEWFESDALKGVLGAIGVTGSRQGPRAAGTTLTFLYQQLGGFLNHRFLVGGIGQLATVLAEAAKQHDTEIRTQTAVTRIVLQDGRAIGVETDAGDIIKANIIISNADPKRTFLQLVGAPNLPPRFVRQVRAMLYRGSTAKVNLALSDLPQFNGQTETTQLGGHIRISPSLDYVERAYDAAKYGRFSEKPVLDMTIPTLHDATLAPDGRHILSITMQYAPYKLRNSTWETQREVLGDTIMNTVAQYAPNIKACILHRQILTPLDWETTYSLTEGSIFHGQMGLDQLFIMRPLPSWAQYSTPIDNLYLCGAGTHPGGGVTGIPGYNAAQKVLQELS